MVATDPGLWTPTHWTPTHWTSDFRHLDLRHGRRKADIGHLDSGHSHVIFFRTRMNIAHVSVISKDTKYGIQSGDLGQVVLQKSKGDNSRGWGIITDIENKVGFHI